MTDCTIIKKLKQSKEKALEILMERYSSYVATIVIRVGGYLLSVQDVEEIVSDVFYTIWKKRETLIESESLKPYIAQIARNMTKKSLLKKKDTDSLEDDILIFKTVGMEEQLVQKEELQFLRETIAQLKFPDKDILIAYYFWNFKLDEISKRFQLPLSTVKTKIYRGRKEIIKRFEEGGYQYET